MGSSGTSCPPQPHLEGMRTPPFLTYLEAFPRGDQSMKVVRYDPYDTAGPSGPLSGTSCPPQPHLEVKRTPPFLTYLEAFPRVDQSMKVVSYDPYDTAGPSGSLSGTSCPPQPHLEDTPILDVIRGISEGRPFYESFLLQPIGHSW